MTTTEYRVTGMTCEHCEHAVGGEVAKIAGVEKATASAATGILTVESASPVDEAAIAAAVDEAGYALA